VSDTQSSKKFFTPPEKPKGPATQVRELRDLVVTYSKQETVDPLKTLGRYLGWGIGGAIFIGVGWIFGLLALLRGLQQIPGLNDPSESAGGAWSWVPYAAVTVVGLLVVAAYGWMVRRRLDEDTGLRGEQ